MNLKRPGVDTKEFFFIYRDVISITFFFCDTLFNILTFDELISSFMQEVTGFHHHVN